MTEASALDVLRERLRGERSGEVEVTDVRIEHLLDADGEEYVWVALILSDPAPGRETWPVRNVYDLETRAYTEAAKLNITSDLTIAVRSHDGYDDGGDR